MNEKATVVKVTEAKATKSAQQKRQPDISSSLRSIAGQIVVLQRSIGNRGVAQLHRLGLLQAKLRIGRPNDIYEEEANRVADQVMRMIEAEVETKPT
jgi:hypothetical protein